MGIMKKVSMGFLTFILVASSWGMESVLGNGFVQAASVGIKKEESLSRMSKQLISGVWMATVDEDYYIQVVF